MKYLNTYGKHKTKLSAWVSIQDRDRKQVFDSTSSESSVQQAPKPRRKSHRKTTVKRRKATKTLPTSDDEEEDDVFTHAVPPSRSTARPKPIGRPIRAGKRKPLVQSVSSDEENVAPTQNIRRGRRKKPISNNDDIPDRNKCPLVSYQSSGSKSRSSEKEKTTHHNTILKDSIVGPSAGRFVTRRRFAVSSKARLLSLNSSEDFVPLKRTKIKHTSQENISDRSVSVLGRVSDGKMDRLKENRDTMWRNETSACSNNEPSKKRRKISLASEERACGTQRPGTTRKACVSGLSVKRWKSRDAFTASFGQRGGTKTMDCSINDLMPRQHRQPMDFTTPIKGHNLNLSSLLAELTPSTHTWSRLKAALSVHRKVICTPKTPGASMCSRKVLEAFSPDLFTTPVRTTRSQLITRESQLVLDEDMSDAEKVCAECSQQGPLAWDQCLLPQRIKQCVKIGEGTFGEVFSTTSGKPDGEIVALKVIPVEGSEKVNGEEQKTFGEILHEIIISKELSCLKEKENNQTSGFIGLRDLHCVKGAYPPEFLKAWDKFDKVKGSENDRPDFFGDNQLFIILEFEFGGTDLENSNGVLPSIIAAKGILHQVTAALAVAEQELQFEHRDLHWGNVLVKVTKEKTAEFKLNGMSHSLETKGVLVRIIDYSLSRLEIDELTVSCDISNDEELFMGQGDYQFDIYRLMRQENNNEWDSYNPHSNVLWLHYLCSKLLHMKYRRSAGKRNKDELKSFYDNVLQFRSATEVLWNSPLFQ
uniref:Serine/threonine-protein kinase haspin n=1 Tax=Knipowitschia caucasica TaxID=637954 RepID=A0AAV2LIR1_KNICA